MCRYRLLQSRQFKNKQIKTLWKITNAYNTSREFTELQFNIDSDKALDKAMHWSRSCPIHVFAEWN